MNERTIFMEALEKDSNSERAAYLDVVCGDDPDLRLRVELLLQSDKDAGEFLDKPIPERLAGPARDDNRGGLTASSVDNRLAFLAVSDTPGSLSRLGHYEVLEIVGRGGMEVVLKALDEKLQRTVAIKAMAPELAAALTARKRFVREARAAAAVRDEHVIDIHAVEDSDPVPYLVMEYVSGVSLQQRLDEGRPLGLAEILRIGSQVAAGLAAAHRQGLVHRDIKPANILLENGVPRVKLTDFGLARAVDDASLTLAGVVAGTPRYMAPEQADGGPVDHRSDLFGLGSVLYAMAAGHPPFTGDSTASVLRRVAEAAPRPLREANPNVPDWLEDIVARLHARNPDDRFQSAEEVAELLGRHLAHLQQPARVARPAPVRLPAKVGGRRGRRLAWVTVLCAFAGLGLAEATGATRLRSAVTGLIHRDAAGPVPSVSKPPPGEIARFEGHKHHVWTVVYHPAGRLALSGGWDGTVRLWELETRKEVGRLGGDLKRTTAVAFSPDGGRALTGGSDGFVRLWDVESRQELHRFEGLQFVNSMAFVDNRRALFGGWSYEATERGNVPTDCEIRMVDLETHQELSRFKGHTGRVMRLAVSPDGTRLLSGANSWDKSGKPHDTTMRLWDIATGEEIGRFEGHKRGIGGVAFSPDGRRALSCSIDETVRLWDVETRIEIRQLIDHNLWVDNVAFTTDGHHAVGSGGSPHIWVWNVETGRVVQVLTGHTNQVPALALSPDGTRALSGGYDRTMRLWQLP